MTDLEKILHKLDQLEKRIDALETFYRTGRKSRRPPRRKPKGWELDAELDARAREFHSRG